MNDYIIEVTFGGFSSMSAEKAAILEAAAGRSIEEVELYDDAFTGEKVIDWVQVRVRAAGENVAIISAVLELAALDLPLTDIAGFAIVFDSETDE